MSNVAPLQSISVQGDWPSGWNITEHSIAKGRYIDPAFVKLEYEKLWSKVWQWAARLDEIPAPGDFTTYDVGDQSVLVTRIDQATVKAYHNVCPHRGTALTQGCGHFKNDKIICPFHGWRWNLAGQNEYVLERQEFRGGKLQNSDVALRELKVEVWAGFVFINFDKNPQPFADLIAPVRQMVEDLAIGEMHHYWWKSLKVPANWKVTQEAFFETYHVAATHPQLDNPGSEVIYEGRADAPFNHRNVDYEVYPGGHGRFYGGRKTPMAGYVAEGETGDPVEDMITRMSHLVHEMDAMVLQEDIDIAKMLRGTTVPEGSSIGGEYVKLLYQQAALQQRPMPVPKPETLGMWGGEVFIFPNLMILPNAGNAMFYRARPDGMNPDQCIFEIYSTKTYSAKDQPPRAVVQKKADGSNSDELLLIPTQDMSNIPRIQKGLHSNGIRNIWLASYNEKMILNMHQELDRYLRA